MAALANSRSGSYPELSGGVRTLFGTRLSDLQHVRVPDRQFSLCSIKRTTSDIEMSSCKEIGITFG